SEGCADEQAGAVWVVGVGAGVRAAVGGCRLAKDATEIRVADIVDAIEGQTYPMHCLDVEDHTCFADSHCGLQELWGDVDHAVRRVLETTTLGDLADRHRRRIEPPLWAPSELLRPRP